VPSPHARTAAPALPGHGRLRPLTLDEVHLTDGLWHHLQQVNGEATLDHLRSWTERLGWVQAFTDASAAGTPADRRGREFTDSEIYKYAEAVAWEAARTGSPALLEHLEKLAATVGSAQAEDGYLHTAFGRPGQPERWSDLAFGHELYCAGHLLQAAVAHARSGAGEAWLQIARRVADQVCDRFGPDGVQAVCGHPEIETALVELHRTTGEPRYLQQAALFVERRGRGTLPPHEFGAAYFLDDEPVREAEVLRGHAVRALYLAAGAVDVAVETEDTELLQSVLTQWQNTLARRTYVTGGMGSRHQDEAFSDDWVLPADRAYAETCAGVAGVMLAWRLLLATGDARHADVVERLLYNVVATSPGDDGRSFFYANTLHQRTPTELPDPEGESLAFGGGGRQPWFEVSCCLPNVARLLASLDGYLATADDDGVQLHQYASCDVATELPAGRVGLQVRTRYPDEGSVVVTVTEAPGWDWTLSLRVPSWSRGRARLTVDGVEQAVGHDTAVVHGSLPAGTTVVLELDTAPRWTFPDTRIDAVRGCVTAQRGPDVLCLDATTGTDLDLDRVAVDVAAGLAPADGGGAQVTVQVRPDAGPRDGDGLPYGEAPAHLVGSEQRTVDLVPYRRWGRTGSSTMRVWLPTA